MTDDINPLAPLLGGQGALVGPGNTPSLGGSRSCAVCGRLLTSPDSIRQGMGPVCAGGDYNRFTEGRIPRFRVQGVRGVTGKTLEALGDLVKRRKPKRVLAINYRHVTDMPESRSWWHGLVLEMANGELLVIADGFASGYGGEGPRGLESAMALLADLPVPPSSITLDEAHAHALFDGELDPKQLLHLARPLVIDIKPPQGEAAVFEPYANEALTPARPTDRLWLRPRPRQAKLPM